MCEQLAQTETSASNLLMIDWNAGATAGIGQSSTDMRTNLQALVDFAYQVRSAS